MTDRPSEPDEEQQIHVVGPRELPLVALRETVIFPR